MADRGDTEGAENAPPVEWRHGGVVARSVRCAVGFRKRRTAPGVEFDAGDVRVRFLSRELAVFLDGGAGQLEAGSGLLFYLCRVGANPPGGGEKTLADVPPGSIALLAASHRLLTPVAVLPPDVAAGFGHWFRSLP